MPKLLFGHSVQQSAGGGGGDTAKPGDWDPVFTQEDDGKAPSTSVLNPTKSDAITLKPKKTRTPDGVHRDFLTEERGTGAPAEVAVGMGEKSESNHEYKYAPGLAPFARLVFATEPTGFWITPDGKYEPFSAEAASHAGAYADISGQAYEDLYNETLSDSKIVDKALEEGYTRGWYVSHSGLNLQTLKGEAEIEDLLKKIPQELLFATELNVDFGAHNSSGRASYITVPIDEGEDALDAWKSRNSSRKRVKASYEPLKYWVAPSGDYYIVDAHGDWPYDQPQWYKKHAGSEAITNALKTKSRDKEALGISALVDNGWVRVDGDALSGLASSLPRMKSFVKDQILPDDREMKIFVHLDDTGAEFEGSAKDFMRWGGVTAELAQTYQERQSNVTPQDPPGYPDRIEDSNATPRRPGRRGDKNVALDRLPDEKSYPSGSPEPPDAVDTGLGNMIYPLAGILFIKAAEFKEVVEDPENFLRHTYIWTSEPNRLPSSVLVQVADLNEPGTTEEQPNMTLVIGPDGRWTMDKEASGNWIPHPPTHEHPEADFPAERMDIAYQSAIQHLPKVLKDTSEKVVKKLGSQEKDDAPKRKSYNVLEDPALDLAPGITPEEKIFTTIQDWDENTFFGDVSKMDKATLAILKEHPKSNRNKHKYFRWDYISEDDLKKGADKDIEKLGYTVGTEPALIVERLPAWRKVEDQVKQARKEKASS